MFSACRLMALWAAALTRIAGLHRYAIPSGSALVRSIEFDSPTIYKED